METDNSDRIEVNCLDKEISMCYINLDLSKDWDKSKQKTAVKE